MTLNQLRYFRVLAKTEHYTKAADALAISQPSLSRAIALLEEELGVLLSMVQAGLGLFISTDHPQMYSPDTVLVPLKQERYRQYVYMVTRPGLAASTAAAQLRPLRVQLSQRESLWRNRKLCMDCRQRLPLWGSWQSLQGFD